MLPVPQGEDADQDEEDDPLAAMKADLKSLGGGLALVETTAAGFGEGRGAAPTIQAWTGSTGGTLYAPGGREPERFGSLRNQPGHGRRAKRRHGTA